MQATSSGGSISSGGGGGGTGGSGSGSGGGGGGLARFRSAPATWLEALLEDEEEDPLKPNQNLTQLLASGSPSASSRSAFGSGEAEAGGGLFGPGGGGGGGGGGGSGFQRQNSSPADLLGTSSGIGGDGYFSNYGLASNYEYLSQNMDVSPSVKRGREIELDNPSANKYPSQLKVEQGSQVPARATSLIEMEMDKLLEDSVPCRVRAKRGCATHPRSIAERVRRTKISDRIRKLQELVPNMDKQTNTADMLEEAVEYVKFLQKQIQELTEHQRKCKCTASE